MSVQYWNISVKKLEVKCFFIASKANMYFTFPSNFNDRPSYPIFSH